MLNDIITYNRFGILFNCILYSIQSSNNTLIASNFAILDWNIEINTEITMKIVNKFV